MSTDSTPPAHGPDADRDVREPRIETDAIALDADASRPVDLRSVVASYEGTPDRRTVYPADATEADRLTHWLSADDDAFSRLDEMC